MTLLLNMAPMKGWLLVGSNGGAFGVKNISCTITRKANRKKEQLFFKEKVSISEPFEEIRRDGKASWPYSI